MGSYNLPEIIQMWEHDKLTTEQAVGQLLLQLQELAERVGQLEQRVAEIRRPGEHHSRK
ncbi:MAG: hypothetical protein L0332_01980 [Chloroflexi bacterium]|nr:hypothetical protein [Chloroflexota bacterium]MCI0580896.1 hypothetical protein [Chloroflexota bacterium]MCI0649744.1 hypothetical protein [Chloroflexota bacterium]MCI0725483.1 hypothetical protein [Chloroflexota bacterium]